MQLENSRIEYKEILNDSFEKTIIGFLNSREGGCCYIGINNAGEAVGIDNIDNTQLTVTNKIRDSILPPTLGLFDVDAQIISGKSVVKITISSGTLKPYYIKSKGMSPSGCFIRIGSSTQPMNIDMIDDMYSKRITKTLATTKSPRQDLSFEQLKIYYQENNLILKDQFKRNLEFYTEEGNYNYISYLLADDNGTSIKVAKYSGLDKVDLIQNEEYGYCSLIKATKNVLNKLEIENITSAKITSKERLEKNLIDKLSLREAAINAIVHNDYSRGIPPLFEIFSDRIEITSYGGLVTGLSKEDFFNCCSMPRNRELMRVFKDLNIVEHLGSGMSRILQKYDKSIFTFMNNFIKVSFTFDKEVIALRKKSADKNASKNADKNASKNADKILQILHINSAITREELASILGVSTRTVDKNIGLLKSESKIIRIGSKKQGYWEVL